MKKCTNGGLFYKNQIYELSILWKAKMNLTILILEKIGYN